MDAQAHRRATLRLQDLRIARTSYCHSTGPLDKRDGRVTQRAAGATTRPGAASPRACGDKHLYEGFRVADLHVGPHPRRPAGLPAGAGQRAPARPRRRTRSTSPQRRRRLRAGCRFAGADRVCRYGEVAALNDAWRAGKNAFCSKAHRRPCSTWTSGPTRLSPRASTGANGISSGTGLPPRAVDRIVAVAKAYATRVGSNAGPVPDARDERRRRARHMQEAGPQSSEPSPDGRAGAGGSTPSPCATCAEHNGIDSRRTHQDRRAARDWIR